MKIPTLKVQSEDEEVALENSDDKLDLESVWRGGFR